MLDFLQEAGRQRLREEAAEEVRCGGGGTRVAIFGETVSV